MQSSFAIVLIAASPVALAGTIDFRHDPHADRHTMFLDNPESMNVTPAGWIPVVSNGVGDSLAAGDERDDSLSLSSMSSSSVPDAPADRYDLRQFIRSGRLLDTGTGFDPIATPPATGLGDRLDFVPTPGSIALLSVGGLGLIARKGG